MGELLDKLNVANTCHSKHPDNRYRATQDQCAEDCSFVSEAVRAALNSCNLRVGRCTSSDNGRANMTAALEFVYLKLPPGDNRKAIADAITAAATDGKTRLKDGATIV